MMIILIFKQVIMNLWEYLEDKYSTGRKVQRIKDRFAEKIAQEKDEVKRLDLEMYSDVE